MSVCNTPSLCCDVDIIFSRRAGTTLHRWDEVGLSASTSRLCASQHAFLEGTVIFIARKHTKSLHLKHYSNQTTQNFHFETPTSKRTPCLGQQVLITTMKGKCAFGWIRRSLWWKWCSMPLVDQRTCLDYVFWLFLHDNTLQCVPIVEFHIWVKVVSTSNVIFTFELHWAEIENMKMMWWSEFSNALNYFMWYSPEIPLYRQLNRF